MSNLPQISEAEFEVNNIRYSRKRNVQTLFYHTDLLRLLRESPDNLNQGDRREFCVLRIVRSVPA